MDQLFWYNELLKPAWAPPAFLFSPVWSVLYAIIALTFGYVFYLAWKKRLPRQVVLPFGFNIVFNLAFTPIQFVLKNNFLAAVNITLVFATLIWALIVIYPHMRVVTWANIPYLLWVSFALVLQYTITFLNW